MPNIKSSVKTQISNLGSQISNFVGIHREILIASSINPHKEHYNIAELNRAEVAVDVDSAEEPGELTEELELTEKLQPMKELEFT